MDIKKYYPILFSIFGVFIIRILFSFLPSFHYDMGSWLGWADRLVKVGFANFYTDQSWTQYTPGFMYYLWVIGKLGWVNPLAVKILVSLADLLTGFIIWTLVKNKNVKLAYLSFFAYALNPVVVFDGSVWGQVDGLLTLFLFLSAYYLIEKKNMKISVFFWSIAFLIKPQSIAIAPAFLLPVLLKKFKLKEILGSVLIGALTVFGLSIPFFTNNPILGLPQQILKMGNFYSYTSVYAFNIWSWVGFWKSDATTFLGLSLSSIGVILLSFSMVLALLIFRKKINKKHNYYLLFAILSLCFFVFPTKVHERYLFPFFAFLLTGAGLSESTNLFAVYIVTSMASFFNLYYPYSYYYPTQIRSDFLYMLSGGLAKIIGFIFFITYFVLLSWEKLPKISMSIFTVKKKEIKLPKISLSKKNAKIILAIILTFAFVTRVFDLGSPPNEYFDEVYHAFTAKVILHGDPKAWEWWNTPPTGFAYEWTHPPLAKLGMVAGMLTFGENAFGYRIPGAILGFGIVYLVYLLAKNLFEDEAIGLLSAGVFSLDGLALVMSRIGMNDSYMLFFALLSIYLFIKQKDFLAALYFGLSLASKWSAIWAIPIFGILWLWRKPLKENPSKILKTFFLFSLLPLAIYLLSYFDMFLTGHSLSIWWEMQKQMWWYHTNLKATHPYSSPWWSWPLLIRPIYLYTSNEVSGWVSRIYAFGNPIVFWFGLTSVITSMIYAYVEKNKKLSLVVFSYLVFFVPWALSPRIMFLYHYLPSIPFMAIAIGFVLRRNSKLILPFFISAIILFIYFYPHWAGLKVPVWLDASYYWVPTWR